MANIDECNCDICKMDDIPKGFDLELLEIQVRLREKHKRQEVSESGHKPHHIMEDDEDWGDSYGGCWVD